MIKVIDAQGHIGDILSPSGGEPIFGRGMERRYCLDLPPLAFLAISGVARDSHRPGGFGAAAMRKHPYGQVFPSGFGMESAVCADPSGGQLEG